MWRDSVRDALNSFDVATQTLLRRWFVGGSQGAANGCWLPGSKRTEEMIHPVLHALVLTPEPLSVSTAAAAESLNPQSTRCPLEG